MAEVYYYVPTDKVDDIIECGIKLSESSDKEVEIRPLRAIKKCFSALLNPKDDIEKYQNENWKCIKITINSEHCFVGDRNLYEMGINSPEIMEYYLDSVVPLDTYSFGKYRIPECLILTTVLSEQISIWKKNLDTPLLFSNSEQLYIENLIQSYKEKFEEFNDVMMYSFCNEMVNQEKMSKKADYNKGMAVFISKSLPDKRIILPIPNLSKYC